MKTKQIIKYLIFYSLSLMLIGLSVFQIILADPITGFHNMPIWGP